MTRVRTVFFWIHLAAGAAAGLIILVLSVTGAALAFKPQIVRAVDTAGFSIQADGRQPLAASALIETLKSERPDAEVRSVTLARDEASAVIVQSSAGTMYVDPYTGQVLGASSTRTEQVFRSLENWHRWLARSGDTRQAGRRIVGIANAAFLFLTLSGLYLWWPRAWTWRHLRPIVWFKPASTGKARDFNWHHVAGLWSAPMLVVMTATGMLMSYPSLNARLQQAVGGAPVERRGAEPGGAGRPAGRGEGGPAGPDSQRRRDAAASVRVDGGVIDKAVNEAASVSDAWRSVTVEMPRSAGAAVTAFISTGSSTPAGRSQLTLDSSTGEVTGRQLAASAGVAQRLRTWVRFGHTGEQWGVIGQTVAALSCLGGVLLVWSGLALAVRRTLAAMARTRRRDSTVAAIASAEARV